MSNGSANRGAFIVFSGPLDDASEAEFNRWYDEVHIPECRMALPGIRSVQRYRVLGGFGGSKHRYAVIYNLELDNLEDFLEASKRLRASGKLTMSDAVNMAAISATLCEIVAS